MTEMLLLGAGASMEAGIPHSIGMTTRILEEFQKQYSLRRESEVLTFVIGGLLFQQGIQGRNPLSSGVNVEELFNAVKLLSERHALEAAPFVGSWHTMVDEFDIIEPNYGGFSELYRSIHRGIIEQLTSRIPQSVGGLAGQSIDKNIDEKIKRAIESAIKKTDMAIAQVTHYHVKLANMLLDLLKNG